MKITIAVDAMGGDHGLEVSIPAAARFLASHPDTCLILVGQEEPLKEAIAGQLADFKERIEIIHADEVVSMDESPQNALKNKKNSSMRLAINLVKEQKAQAIVSAGNTGALMATARFVLKTLEGVDRPAIAKFMPGSDTVSCMLDLGANVDCSSEQLLQFAIMGVELTKAVQKIENPKVGLLNIGTEEIKGNEITKEAYILLKNSSLNFIGNVEADGIFKNTADVVVCDGFVGNIALKTLEGTARMVGIFIKKAFMRTLYARICALISTPSLNFLKAQLDPRRYNGAIFLGLRGIVIKSHGGTDEIGFAYALHEAYAEIKNNVLGHLEQGVSKHILQLNQQTAENIDKDTQP